MSQATLRIFHLLAWAVFALVLAILALSFVMITRQAGTWAPWFLPVHEDGVHSFLGTMFYFDHAAREWPLDMLLAGSVGAAAAFGLGPARPAGAAPFWLGTAVVTLVIFLGTVLTLGAGELWLNLSQVHTRAGADLVVGAHWYYHFLSRGALLISVIALGLVARGVTGSTERGLPVLLTGPAGFIALCAIFYSPELMTNALRDPVYLGHQAREVFTHGLTTLPLAVAACLLCAPVPRGRPRRGPVLAGLGLLVLAVAMAGYVGAAAMAGDAAGQGQSQDMGVLIFPHFFEHFLGYCLVIFMAAATYVSLTRAPGR